MKALKRNAIPVWYALYLGEEDILDTNEHPTGERRARYGPLRKMMANVNAGFNGRYGINSQSAVEPFGVDLRYDKTLVVADMDCPMMSSPSLSLTAPSTTNTDSLCLMTGNRFTMTMDSSFSTISSSRWTSPSTSCHTH